jgi:hypothetical protein
MKQVSIERGGGCEKIKSKEQTSNQASEVVVADEVDAEAGRVF